MQAASPYTPQDHYTPSWISQWWESVDKGLIAGFLILSFIGLVLIASAGPSVARRIGISDGLLPAEWWFFTKYTIFSLMSLTVMVIISMMSPVMVRRIGIMMFLGAFLMLCLVPFMGTEIKGARRWIFGIQPSEFMKPGLVMVTAWLMSLAKEYEKFPGMVWSLIVTALTATLLLMQPDFGQTILIISVWVAMFFSAGANLLWFVGFSGFAVVGVCAAYYSFAHVRNRVDAFLSPDDFDKFGVNYQSDVANKAFSAGGLLGRGPGEGEIKNSLPDAHTDYIFAVAGEELGLLFCVVIMSVYAYMVIRGMMRIAPVYDHFSRFAVVGLMTLFGLQAFINMAVNVGLFPPKGMTLPFISYGGSSVLALGFLAGFVLCLSRNRPIGFKV